MRFRPAIVAATLLVAGAVGTVAAAHSVTGGLDAPDATRLEPTSLMAVFDDRSRTASDGDVELPATIGDQKVDPSTARVLVDGVGAYRSRLVAYASTTGSRLCYRIEGETRTDPAMSYCYEPLAADGPADVKGRHFDASALYSNLAHGPMVQVFGVAFDDVEGLRVRVSGTWRSVPLVANGFLLELPGVALSGVTLVEATLADGTTQLQNLQTGA